MSLEFTRVTYDSDIEDLSEERLRELVREFKDAQESNHTEFSEVASSMDEELQEFEQLKENLIEQIKKAEGFSEIPLSEDRLEDVSFSTLREWDNYLQETESDEGGEEVEDFGERSPDGGGSTGFESEVESAVADIPGVCFE